MKSAYLLFALFVAEMPALADEPKITIEQKIVPAEQSPIKLREIYLTGELHSQGCEMSLLIDNRGTGLADLSLAEECKTQVAAGETSRMREMLLAKVFSTGAFANIGKFELSFNNSPEGDGFGCGLIRHASGSPAWPPLLALLQIAPTAYEYLAWSNLPENFSAGFGTLVRDSGMLADFENFFRSHGYRLNGVAADEVHVSHLKMLDVSQRKCLDAQPVAERVPTDAHLTMEFEATEPAKAASTGKR